MQKPGDERAEKGADRGGASSGGYNYWLDQGQVVLGEQEVGDDFMAVMMLRGSSGRFGGERSQAHSL